jgi:predicted Zn finger-like uncharacterized protein
MILTCPNCGTQYVVKDGAVPPQGRQVRCAACKHSWHQDPEADDTAPETESDAALPVTEAEQPAGELTSAGAQDASEEPEESDETLAEATLIEPRGGPEAEERAYEEAVIGSEPADAQPHVDNLPPLRPSKFAGIEEDDDFIEPSPRSNPIPPRASELLSELAAPTGSTPHDEFSPFAERDELEQRRRSPLVTILMLVVAIAALAAAFWFLAPPEWKARVGLADPGKTPLELMITHPDRQKLASGQESLTITGRVINPTDGTHSVPPIYAQLKSRTGQVIYSWTIAPPAPTLGPRASAPFNSTEVSVPSGGEDLTISLGAPKA